MNHKNPRPSNSTMIKQGRSYWLHNQRPAKFEKLKIRPSKIWISFIWLFWTLIHMNALGSRQMALVCVCNILSVFVSFVSARRFTFQISAHELNGHVRRQEVKCMTYVKKYAIDFRVFCTKQKVGRWKRIVFRDVCVTWIFFKVRLFVCLLF